MNWPLFSLFFFIPALLGWVVGMRIHISEASVPFIPNDRANLIVFLLIVLGIVWVVVNPARSIADSWITLGCFLAVSTLNLAASLTFRQRRFKASKS